MIQAQVGIPISLHMSAFQGKDHRRQQQHDQDQRRRDEEAEKQKKQDIYDTRMAIDRYQKTIAHCTSEIAKVDAQVADPSVSDYEKEQITRLSKHAKRLSR